ncbi:hypothetical protein I316_04632 [Kwoniella heveanensis BCC8398]|uniref:Uncharacterized protein n=1 Tax=Kwoniella heveanensis BCC8398 TaxID=1296120 RepID=A0A1B9GR60_9TREE|nr:hypothetical protein I316_04632 [Kwoniella heveanensis BCC8398]
MSSVDSTTSSLLIPPNPSLSSTKPSASILLNGTGRAPSVAPTPASPPRSTTPQLGSYSPASSYSFVPSSPTASSSSRSLSAHGSFSSTTTSSSISGPARPTPIRRGSTPKISFAPLPEIPVELKRRNSITIGVASRKNLLTGQGSAAGGGGGPRGSNRVMMTDQEWEDYKRHFEEKNGSNDVVDLGAVAKQGAKALWGKMKRGRSPSTSSTTSSVASSSTTSSAPPSASASNTFSGSAPLVRATSSPAKSGAAAAAAGAGGLSLGTVTEEEQGGEVSPTASTSGTYPFHPNTSSTRRPRSSSSPPPSSRDMGRSGAGLHVIPGSPPPSRNNKALYGERNGASANLSPATTMSTISDNEIDNDTETESEADPEGERQAEAEAESDPHDAGFRAAEASLHQKNKLLDLDTSDEGEGDVTPRRIPSPPPRRAELGPLVEEDAVWDNDEDDDDGDDEGESAGAEGSKTPSGLSENGWQTRGGKAYKSGDNNAQGRHDHTEVLGFDPERFGRALDLATKRGD